MSKRGRRISCIYHTRSQARAGNIDPFHYDDIPEDDEIDPPPDEPLLNFGAKSFGVAEERAMRQFVGALLLTGGPARSRRVEKRLGMTKSNKRGSKDLEFGSRSDTTSSSSSYSKSSSDDEDHKKKKNTPDKKKKDKTGSRDCGSTSIVQIEEYKEEICCNDLEHLEQEVEVLAVRRSKAKGLIDWEQQKG
ncbi:hypothetical protein L7F22_001708, partial [Adiantum nelumboides]|nr:hypothetical protein [Adiantum nelumboides]